MWRFRLPSTASPCSEGRAAADRSGPRPGRLRLVRALVLGGAACLVWAAAPARPQLPPAQVERLETEALQRRAADRIRALRKEAETLASRERSLLDELRRLEVERDLRTEQYDQDTRELTAIEGQIADASSRLTSLQERARSQLPDLSARLVELYKLGNGGYLRLMLSVDDLREMGRAYRFVSALQHIDAERVREHRKTLAEVTATLGALKAQRERLAAVKEEAGRAKLAAEKAASAREALIAQIDASRDLNAQWVAELQSAQQKLQQAIARMAGGEPRPNEPGLSLPIRPFRGAIEWPADGRVTVPFGRQRNSRFNTAVIRNGVEIAARANAPVFAVHEGTVAFADFFSGFGNLVIVDHGSQAFSLYGNLADMSVTQGARVARGQSVGSVGAALADARPGGPTLYFELRIDGKPVDPVEWLKKR
jgi:septal ring factor EnvC (AmiA/AmiB activator)